MRKQQRLVVCLDGTWNKKDDGTNVLHHFALAVNGQVPSADNAVTQIPYYHEGVGTGVLDGFTGDSFGFGLEENVRQAYDWLVEHFHADGEKPDEIYIFGFSRGAFTARSLVGFIGTFGLLRRGAPLSVNQLWSEYCLLGRARERNEGIWDRLLGQPWTQHRRINDLIADPWNVDRVEAGRRQPLPDGELRGLLVDPRAMNTAERLLVTWSRRVRITFLGVYDTVGAIGLDALAIPGLTSKLAMHHNMRPTSLIQQCRHALAVDEHRGAFSHTPFLEFVGHGGDEDDAQLDALKKKDPEAHWVQSHAMWRRKIAQRWFVGAHSNVGGGYPDNELAQIPLQWLIEGAREAGLECEDLLSGPQMARLALQQTLAGASPSGVKPPQPRDSYAEFASPYFTSIIRGKRYYRTIDPPPEVRASSEQEDAALAPLVVLIAWAASLLLAPWWRGTPASPSLPALNAALAGELLLLQVAIFYFLHSLTWVASPTVRANLGSIVRLQLCATPAAVGACLERWRRLLACQWGQRDEDATRGPAVRAMRRAIRQALWRDVVGFIPVYAMVFGYGLWFASHPLYRAFESQPGGGGVLALLGFLNTSLGGVALWLLLPLVAALGDLVEDAAHLRYLTLHEQAVAPSAGLTLLAFGGSVLKFLVFIPVLLLTLAAGALGIWRVLMLGQSTGWRGTVALVISAFVAVSVASIAIGILFYRRRSQRERQRSAGAMREIRPSAEFAG